MKHEAIYNLYPNVRSINETEDGIFTAYDENKNVVNVDMPAVEIKAVELQQEAEEKETKRKEDKLSAYRKLSMTDDEIRTLDPSLLD